MKTRKVRKSPQESATEVPEGTVRLGGNRQFWVAKRIGKSNRWIPSDTAELFGLRKLTVDDLVAGRTIIFYEREYCDNWPTLKDHRAMEGCQLYKVVFTPSGHADVGGKTIPRWLETRRPPIKDRTVFTVNGRLEYENNKPIDAGLQVDSRNKRLVSSRIMNMEAFIQI